METTHIPVMHHFPLVDIDLLDYVFLCLESEGEWYDIDCITPSSAD